MLPVAWLVVAVLLAVLATAWVTFTTTRLDRLHARVDAAQAAMDAQLVRRAAALAHVAETAGEHLEDGERVDCERVAQAALSRGPRAASGGRERGRPSADRDWPSAGPTCPPPTAAELREAALRVQIARRFYNDAVRDTRTLRARRMPRALHLAGHRELPQFFDIDDTLPPEPVPVRRPRVPGGTVPPPT